MKSALFFTALLASCFTFAFDTSDFSEPPATYRLKQNYAKIDPQNQIREASLRKALKFFEYNKAKTDNEHYMTLIDFSKPSGARRLFQIDMHTGKVLSMLVAAGRGSDENGDGRASEFSNEDGSHMSSLGFYLTGDEYEGEHGSSLRLFGLSRTNSNVLDRAIVIHGADYVTEDNAGRSFGCPAVSLKNVGPLIDRLKGGSLLYIFAD